MYTIGRFGKLFPIPVPRTAIISVAARPAPPPKPEIPMIRLPAISMRWYRPRILPAQKMASVLISAVSAATATRKRFLPLTSGSTITLRQLPISRIRICCVTVACGSRLKRNGKPMPQRCGIRVMLPIATVPMLTRSSLNLPRTGTSAASAAQPNKSALEAPQQIFAEGLPPNLRSPQNIAI